MLPYDWILFILSLPGDAGTLRVRLWRVLKALGAGILRDGVYVLPDSDEHRALLAAQVETVSAAGGTGYLLPHVCRDADTQEAFVALFDRGMKYGEWMNQAGEFVKNLPSLSEPAARRRESRLRREFEQIVRIDFFPGSGSDAASVVLDGLTNAVNGTFAADEPKCKTGKVNKLRPADYQGRLWATRKNLWVDRLASAWLIRRFIDPEATFQWLDKPGDCPDSALGFDFDGADFTHVESLVTFEVLLHSFELESDRALTQLARLVHFIDVGGVPVAEADGLVTLLSGIKQQHADDDAVLLAACSLFDHLYSAYS